MKNNNNILLSFSKPIYMTKIDLDSDKIIPLIDKSSFIQSGEQRKEFNTDIDNITESSNDKNVLNKKEFNQLKNKIIKNFNKFKNDYLEYTNDFKITTSWFTKTKPNQSSNYHNHKNCMFSGVLYIKTFENSGNINFINLNNNSSFWLSPKKWNIYNSLEWTIVPKDGLLIFFPSEVHHKILKNNSNNTRYSLAFNLVPTGPIGKGDSFINLMTK